MAQRGPKGQRRTRSRPGGGVHRGGAFFRLAASIRRAAYEFGGLVERAGERAIRLSRVASVFIPVCGSAPAA